MIISWYSVQPTKYARIRTQGHQNVRMYCWELLHQYQDYYLAMYS